MTGETDQRQARREELLDAASRMINAQGLGKVRVAELADRLGMPRKSLYYYVTSRDDLAFQCYHRTCEILARDLEQALTEQTDPAAQIAEFIKINLTDTTDTQVAISDIDFLSGPNQAAAKTAITHLVDRLCTVFEQGKRAGRFWPFDQRLAAYLLLGMLNWSRISHDFLGATDTPTYRRRIAEALTDLLLNGISAGQDTTLAPQPVADDLVIALDDAFDHQRLQEIRLDRMLACASNLFNRHGIAATSLDTIVGALNISKGAIYHYFSSKEDLVARCYERSFNLHLRFYEAAPAGSSGLQRVTTAIHLNAQAMMGRLTPLMGHPGWSALGPAEQKRIIDIVYRLVDVGRATYLQGEKDGSIRRLDTFYVGAAIAGNMLWIAQWFAPKTSAEVMSLADNMTAVLVRGLVSRT